MLRRLARVLSRAPCRTQAAGASPNVICGAFETSARVELKMAIAALIVIALAIGMPVLKCLIDR